MAFKIEPIHYSVGGTSIVLQPFDVPGSRLVDGAVFPLALELTKTSPGPLTPDEAALALRDISERGITTELLNKHGAILIRGVGNPSAKTFSKLVKASEEGRGRKPYEQLGFSGSRTEVDDEVFSASEAPQHVRIGQHNENAIHTRFPSNIHFYCVKAATKGGESPLCHIGELFDRVQAEMPQFVEDLAKKGLLTTDNYQAPGKESKQFPTSWAGTSAFGQDIRPGDDIETMKAKAEKQVKQLTPYFKWLEDDLLQTQEHVPGLRRSPATNRPLWFNSVASRYRFAKDIGAGNPPYVGADGQSYPPSNYRYRDGTQIPIEWLARLVDITDDIVFNFTMSPGDLVLVNNFLVSHGREPWYEGERRILVSMWDTDNPEERIRDY
ncbi:Clavaminate synthase-like protein [Lepidopterella palustris CBS 459.81]|uniref:Clavaminate synthase-like protein n=1 Tax=Lepidopterella palustris CBS 459.81 TaxID=1314670 RepID=A0A8E2DWS1_9PEZI|nr:Clavaminate synthase-like protein [Lepidopterella palustris CBS 459.81]